MLTDIDRAGKINYLGFCEISAASLRRAFAIHPITAVQVEYSPFSLDIETNDLLQTARELGVAVVAYSPLSRGLLTTRYQTLADFSDGMFSSEFRNFGIPVQITNRDTR